MKTKLIVLNLLILLLLACGKEETPEPNQPDDKEDPPVVVDFFDLSMTNIQFNAEKDASLVVVKTNGNWSASNKADWLTLSAKQGDKSTGFIIGASANKHFPREAVISITANNKTKEIKVNQKGVNSIQLNIAGVPFTFLPVEADTLFYLDGMIYTATRRVFLDSYFISETEITNAQWQAVTGSLPYTNESSLPNVPVVVNWNTIKEQFLPKINALSGYKLRLPTENEWEVAARGGKKDIPSAYAGGINLDELAWYWKNSNGKKHDVAMKKPNELGLYDMSGNVSEWCSDWYEQWTETVRPPAESTNPTGPASGTDKVLRGGDFRANRFEYDKNSCSVVSRNHLPPGIDAPEFNIDGHPRYPGFRLVIPKN